MVENKLIYGVGKHVQGKYKCTIGGDRTKEYMLWVSMLARCYNAKYKLSQPTYEGCSVSDNFKDFQYFADWCQAQTGFGSPDFQLDKDLLVRDNKVYSESTCVFIPRAVNVLFTRRAAKRGKFPIGVSASGSKCMANFNSGGGRLKYLGTFNTPEDAFHAYKAAKEGLVKQCAEQYRDQIDERAYAALKAYEVRITD